MHRWLGLFLVLFAWQGCGRNGLDDPTDYTIPFGGSGGHAGTGGFAGGIAGQGGSGGVAGQGGVGGGTAGHGGSGGGTAGHGGSGGGTAGHGGRGGGTAGHGGSGGGTAGQGGFGGGTAGHGGAGGSIVPACVPGQSIACACANGQSGAQTCRPNGTYGACSCVDPEFERVQKGIVGTWVGSDDSPWKDPFQVKISFTADGHYAGHCAEPLGCPAAVFYWGVDDDSPEKTYRLRDLQAGGTVTGDIAIYFVPGDTFQGVIDALTLSPDGQQLKFEVWDQPGGDRHGPILFDLKRTN
jgi:hypothetical protein